jgi:site-specific recombinase XerD
MTELIETSFDEVKKEFLGFLKFTKGYSETTCYGYASHLNCWHNWLTLASVTWNSTKPSDVENFVAYLAKDKIGAHTIVRKISCLSTFYGPSATTRYRTIASSRSKNQTSPQDSGLAGNRGATMIMEF